jgi:hypothetical protein
LPDFPFLVLAKERGNQMLKTKKKVYIASLLFLLLTSYNLLPTVCNAYISFERTYGGIDVEYGFSVQQTVPDGGYILTGWTASFSNPQSDPEAYLVKTDSLGDTLWMKTYGVPGVFTCSRSFSVQQTVPDGGYILVGSIVNDSCIAGDDDVYMIKTDSFGNTLWTRFYGGTADDLGWSVQQTRDEGYIIAGWTESFGAGSRDVWLLKTNSLGDTLWTRAYGGFDGDAGRSVKQTSDGGYILTGWRGNLPNRDVYLIKTDSLGDTLWTKSYGGPNGDEGFSVQQTSDGGYIISGCMECGSPPSDVYLIKTDSLGNTQWTKTYGGAYNDRGLSVQQTSDEGFIISGWKSTSTFGNHRDLYLIKTDPLGDSLWTRTYDYNGLGDNEDVGRSVQETADGGYVIAGFTGGNSSSTDFYFVKPDIWGPEILSACASDGAIPAPGIDDDDYVLITFGEPTNKPDIPPMLGVIDSVLALSGGHNWSDGLGFIESAVWNATGDQLTINLSTGGGLPTVAVGDTIFPDGVTITDLNKWPNPCTSPVVITCSFGPVGVEEESSEFGIRNAEFGLMQNHPNPFHKLTAISYTLPGFRGQGSGVGETIPVHLAVYGLTGRLVETLVEKHQEPGFYQVEWDGKNQSSGIYFYRLQSGDFTSTKKLILLR